MAVARSIRDATIRTLAPVAAFVCAALASLPGYAQQQDKPLADLSLEELSSIEVTSVSRRAERLVDAAASIFVVTQEDIRRAGVTTLPEALRLAPNLQVARLNATKCTQEEKDVARSYDLGANSYVVKPVDFAAVTELVRQAGFYWLAINRTPSG